ncbi:MAG: hypothetical protein QXT28_07035 [Thermofilaceae archaeon]
MACVFCGSNAPTHPVSFPETFTAYQFLQAGSGACSRCLEMFRDPKYRRNNWIITRDGEFRVLENPIEVLLNPPSPPFYIYLTRTRRKHGWILAVNYPALSRDKFFVTVDEERVFVDRQKLEEYWRLYRCFRDKGLRKKDFFSLSPASARKLRLTREEVQALRTLSDDRLWRLVVDFG